MRPLRETSGLPHEWSLRDDIVEKDYVLGWPLRGIASEPGLACSVLANPMTHSEIVSLIWRVASLIHITPRYDFEKLFADAPNLAANLRCYVYKGPRL